MVTIFTQDALLWSTTYACVNYWFVVLVNKNISLPCKCICYKNYKIVPTFNNAMERSCNILYKVRN